MDNDSLSTSTNWCIPGTVMKSAFIKDKLSMCCMNSQSICARNFCKIEELRKIVEVSSVDVACVSETWLNDKTNNATVSLNGYAMVRHDRLGRLGGGVMLYIKNEIKYRVIAMSPNQIGSVSTEYIAIEIMLQNEKILLIALYNPPEVECTIALDYLLSSYGFAYEHIFMLGDFNTNLLANLPKTERLRNLMSIHSLECLGSEPTFFHSYGSSQLDLILTNDTSKVLRFNQIEVPVLSNHDLLFACLDFNCAHSPNLIEFRDYNAIEVDLLVDAFNTVDWRSYYQMSDSNVQLEFLNSVLQNLHDSFVPIRTITRNKKVNPWFDSTICKSIVDRDLLFKKWKMSKNEADHSMFKRARNRVNTLIRHAKERYYASRLDTKLPSKQLWNNIKNLGINRKESHVINDFSADEINNAFCQNFTTSDTPINDSFQHNVHNSDCFYFDHIDQDDVVHAMYSIKSNAIGLDRIPIKFLKSICPVIIKPITHLFNSIITTSVFPDAWKSAKVIPIKKKTNITSVDNLRPISILCALSKIFEKIVKKDICNYIRTNDMLCQYQSGYRSKHSTKTAMLKVLDDIGLILDKGRPVVLILLDFSKAFDTVSYNILCRKLATQFNFANHSVNLIKSYLKSRFQTVFNNGTYSEFASIKSGVPQGSILGPLLFSLYINDLADVVTNCKIHLFADDVQLYYDCSKNSAAEISLSINSDLRKIQEWAYHNMLKLNSRKTNALFISCSSFHETLKPTLILNQETVEYVESAASLGIRVQSNFEWDKYAMSQCGKIYACLRSLYSTSQFLKCETKVKLFKSLILPHFMACDFLLDELSAFTFNRLRVALNACSRYCFNLNRYSNISHLQYLLIGCRFENFSKLRSCLFLHGLLSSKQPDYLYNKLHIARSNRFRHFILPRHHTSKYGNSFFVRGVAHWNSLPSSLSNESSFIAFKRGCIEHFR